MVKTGVLNRCAAVLVVVGFFSGLGGVASGDWRGKPSLADLVSAGQGLPVPAQPVKVRAFSKFTYMAQTKEAVSPQSLIELQDYYKSLAADNEWSLKEDRKTRHGVVLSFCSGKFSRVIEMTGSQPVRLDVSTYWTSSRSSDWYCR